MRGEKNCRPLATERKSGSPPRARGKERGVGLVLGVIGITPACAGKRSVCLDFFAVNEDHPRVRGEKWRVQACTSTSLGSPPRARGKVLRRRHSHGVVGITPACAGKSHVCVFNMPIPEDHPRVRGEKTKKCFYSAIFHGCTLKMHLVCFRYARQARSQPLPGVFADRADQNTGRVFPIYSCSPRLSFGGQSALNQDSDFALVVFGFLRRLPAKIPCQMPHYSRLRFWCPRTIKIGDRFLQNYSIPLQHFVRNACKLHD